MKTISEARLDYSVDESQLDWLVIEGIEDSEGQYGSQILDVSNHAAALAMFEGITTDDVDTANGFIIVRPGTQAHAIAEEIEARLANYPALNEDDFSEREQEAYNESWTNYGYKDFLRLLRDDYVDEYGAAYRFLDDVCTADELRELFETGITSGEYYVPDSDGVSINLRSFRLTRSQLAKWIHAKRIERNPRIAWRDPCQGNLFDHREQDLIDAAR